MTTPAIDQSSILQSEVLASSPPVSPSRGSDLCGFDCCCSNNKAVADDEQTFVQRVICSLSENSILDALQSMRSGASPKSRLSHLNSRDVQQPMSSVIVVPQRGSRCSGKWKTVMLALIGVIALTVALPLIVLRTYESRRGSIHGATQSSSANQSPAPSPFDTPEWKVMSLDETMRDATSVAMSSNGETVAVASPLRFTVLQVNRVPNNDELLWTVVYTEVLPIGNGRPLVAISGDGTTVFIAAVNTSLPILVWKALEGWTQQQSLLVPRSSIQLRRYHNEEHTYRLVDLATTFDGRTCIVGYGNEATTESFFYKNKTLISMEMPNAMTTIFEFQQGVWHERRIPSEFPVNSFGYQVALDDEGLVAVRSSEREMDGVSPTPVRHTAQLIAHMPDSWIGRLSQLDLVSTEECWAVLRSGIGVADDGNTIVVVLNCADQSGFQWLVVRTFDLLTTSGTGGVEIVDNDGSRVDVALSTTRSNSGNDGEQSLVMFLSGDANTLVLNTGSGQLQWMERNFYNGTTTWEEPRTILQKNRRSALSSVSGAKDGSRVVVANVASVGLVIFQKRS